MTGGGGPKADLLKKMIAEEGLESRVEMVGPVPHEKARDLLVNLLVMIPAWCALVAAWCADVVSSAYLLLHITFISCQLTGNRGAHGTTTTSTIAWAFLQFGSSGLLSSPRNKLVMHCSVAYAIHAHVLHHCGIAYATNPFLHC